MGAYRSVPVASLRQIGTLVDLIAGMPMNDPRYVLFLGAGASVSSGIPTAEQLCGRWERRVFLDCCGQAAWQPSAKEAFLKWKKEKYPARKETWQGVYGRQPGDYALLFSYTCPAPDARQGFIENLCSGWEPGPGYIYLTSLTLAGYFHTFLTTNFDDLIHDALFRYGGIKPLVCAFDSQVSSIRPQSPRPKIIKLHGDFLFNNLRNVGGETARLDRNMEEKFERTCESYGLIVLGYSGQDQSIIAPLRAMLHQRNRLNHGLHWCIYSDRSKGSTESVQITEDLYRMWEQYPDKVHLYRIGTFDETMEEIYFGCRCSPPPELSHPETRALYARLRDGIENADQTWRLTPRFSDLLGLFRRAYVRTPPEVLPILDEADQSHRDGDTATKKREFAKGRRQFKQAIKETTKALSMADPAQSVRAWRRRSGSKVSLAGLTAKEQEQDTTRSLDAKLAGEFQQLSSEAREDARKGLETAAQLGSPPELRGHRLNLLFNGLISYAHLVDVGVPLSAEELLEASQWLEEMAGDQIHGDEYIEGLATEEIGGAELLDKLARLDNNAVIEKGDAEAEDKTSTASSENLDPEE